MSVKLSGNDFVAGFADYCKLFGGHLFGFELIVGKSGSFFKYSERVCYLSRHCFYIDADLKILMASLCLRSPKTVCRDFDFAHGIMFYAVFHF